MKHSSPLIKNDRMIKKKDMKTTKYFFFLFIILLIASISACKPNTITNQSEISAQEPTDDSSELVDELEISTPKAEEMDQRIPVIFSHDGALDDIAALLYLSKNPEIEIIGVVNSYGEQNPRESSQEWAAYLYEVLDLDNVPLAVGSETPLDPNGYEFPEGWRVAANNFWDVELPATNAAIDSREGSDLVIDLINSSPVKVTLLVTGAQTDIALALQKDPQIRNNIERIVIMGGAFYSKGNLSGNTGEASNDVAEWNIFVDALAAKQVFNSGIPLTIVPLDGSEDFWITRSIADQLSGSQDAVVQFLSQAWEKEFEIWGGDFLLWDILAAVAVTDPQYFTWENGNLDVISDVGRQHGQTVVIDQANENNEFAVDNDQNGLYTHIIDTILNR